MPTKRQKAKPSKGKRTAVYLRISKDPDGTQDATERQLADCRKYADLHDLEIVDVFEDGRGRTFRVIPSAIWAVQNNLVIGNMDWEDFSDSLDADGVFRGS